MKKYHVCLDIDGGIKNAKDLVGVIKVNGNPLMKVAEIKRFLEHQKDLGREFLPFGDCDNFDYQKGCLGHIVEEEAEKGAVV